MGRKLLRLFISTFPFSTKPSQENCHCIIDAESLSGGGTGGPGLRVTGALSPVAPPRTAPAPEAFLMSKIVFNVYVCGPRVFKLRTVNVCVMITLKLIFYLQIKVKLSPKSNQGFFFAIEYESNLRVKA